MGSRLTGEDSAREVTGRDASEDLVVDGFCTEVEGEEQVEVVPSHAFVGGGDGEWKGGSDGERLGKVGAGVRQFGQGGFEIVQIREEIVATAVEDDAGPVAEAAHTVEHLCQLDPLVVEYRQGRGDGVDSGGDRVVLFGEYVGEAVEAVDGADDVAPLAVQAVDEGFHAC